MYFFTIMFKYELFCEKRNKNTFYLCGINRESEDSGERSFDDVI